MTSYPLQMSSMYQLLLSLESTYQLSHSSSYTLKQMSSCKMNLFLRNNSGIAGTQAHSGSFEPWMTIERPGEATAQ